jgi:hypothetical protein
LIEGGVMVDGVRGDFFMVVVLLLIVRYGETVSMVNVVM